MGGEFSAMMEVAEKTPCEIVKDQLLEAFLGKDLTLESTSGPEQEAQRQQREEAGLNLAAEELKRDPKVFEGIAFEILGSLILGGVGVVDKVAELMMDKNPAGYVNAIFKAADRCTDVYVKFTLVRAVFRRYPGRYRPYILALGRQLMGRPLDKRISDTTIWMLHKFGAEILPDLVGLMRGADAIPERIRILKETAQILGATSLPVITAAADSGVPELSQTALDLLQRF